MITVELTPDEAKLVADALFFWDGWMGERSTTHNEHSTVMAVRRRVIAAIA